MRRKVTPPKYNFAHGRGYIAHWTTTNWFDAVDYGSSVQNDPRIFYCQNFTTTFVCDDTPLRHKCSTKTSFFRQVFFLFGSFFVPWVLKFWDQNCCRYTRLVLQNIVTSVNFVEKVKSVRNFEKTKFFAVFVGFFELKSENFRPVIPCDFNLFFT